MSAGKIIDLASKREHATDRERFLIDVYEAVTRAIDGLVGDPFGDTLIAWHAELEETLWPGRPSEPRLDPS